MNLITSGKENKCGTHPWPQGLANISYCKEILTKRQKLSIIDWCPNPWHNLGPTWAFPFPRKFPLIPAAGSDHFLLCLLTIFGLCLTWCYLVFLEYFSQYPYPVIMDIWKDWCWSWSFNSLATWCEELTHWKRPWFWERLKARGEWDG